MVLLVTENDRTIRPGKPSRNGGDKRGNAATRRARKYWMLYQYGDGETCPCLHCGCELTYATIEADRIIPGSKGGSYRRENVIPACRKCNIARGDTSLWAFNRNLARKLFRASKRNSQ